LGEEHAAVEGGDQETGQPGGIRLSADAAEFLRPPESVPEDVSPLLERAGEFGADVEVWLDDLAGEGTEAASFLAGVLAGNVEACPFPERADAFEAGEPLAAEEGEDAVRLPADDRQDRAFLVGGVMAEL
jgi:hypothetical protein